MFIEDFIFILSLLVSVGRFHIFQFTGIEYMMP